MNTVAQIRAVYQAEIAAQPCGCAACDDGVQPGHFACEQPSGEMLTMERAGQVGRAYEDGRWMWVAVD